MHFIPADKEESGTASSLSCCHFGAFISYGIRPGRGEDRGIHFDDMRIGQAANTAVPIFGRFIKKVFANDKITDVKETDEFEVPESFGYSLDCSDRHISADESEGSISSETITDEVANDDGFIFNF